MLAPIDHALLTNLLDYDPDTGEFRWKSTRGGTARAGSVGGAVCNATGYIRISVAGYKLLAHRLAWFYTYNRWPEIIDHINRDRTDNRIANLRDVTPLGNCLNSGMRKDNTSGYRGVTWCRDTNKWIAQIVIDGRNKKLGRFANIEHAAEARANAEAHMLASLIGG